MSSVRAWSSGLARCVVTRMTRVNRNIRWHEYPDTTQLVEAAVAEISDQAMRAVAARGVFRVVLAGGTTPREVYAALAERDLDWQRWHVYFSDERCLPVGHRDRNDLMAGSALLDRVAINRSQVFAIPAELGPHEGARAYRATLAAVGDFDLTLLGMGEDGHTASLFPGHPLGAEPNAPCALAVEDAPKPPAERVTLSAARLNRSRAVMTIVTGSGKRDAIRQLHEAVDIPIRSITPAAGMDVFLDSAAAIPALPR